MNTTLFDLFDCTVSAGGPPRGTKLAAAADIPKSPTKKRVERSVDDEFDVAWSCLFGDSKPPPSPLQGTPLGAGADILESPTKKRIHSDPLGTAQPQEPQDTVIDFEDISEEALEEWCAALEGLFPSPSKSCRSVKSTQSVNNWEEQTLPPRPAASEVSMASCDSGRRSGPLSARKLSAPSSVAGFELQIPGSRIGRSTDLVLDVNGYGFSGKIFQ